MRGRAWVGLAGVLLVWAGVGGALAQTARDYAVELSVSVSTSPPSVRVAWPAYPGAASYAVHRKRLADPTWVEMAGALGGTSVQWDDAGVALGDAFEYRVTRVAGPRTAYGYVLAGVDTPRRELRGTVLLVVAAGQAALLAEELQRLQLDLLGDGWSVLSITVGVSDGVESVKVQIRAVRAATPGLTTLFLIGHVPVPLSGNLAPDGHAEHRGAWVADTYYGEFDGTWADVSVNTTTANDARNRNVPGDGKFDPSVPPSPVDLEVGRVDFSNLPAFTASETELLRRYLDKNHQFRHRQLTVTARGVIDDHFGEYSGEAFAQDGWRGFAPLVGAAAVSTQDWSVALVNGSALWAYGCGPGSYASCEGVVTTADFAARDYRAVFTLLFGSYFGDWESSPGHYTQNNLLRAALGSGTILACAWAGRPHWVVHPMGLGEHLGVCARLTQNNAGGRYPPFNEGAGRVHIALMGDPTLRQYYVSPPSNLVATVDLHAQAPHAVHLSWASSADGVLGYRVYRAATRSGPYTQLTPSPVAGNAYTDATAPGSSAHYQVSAEARLTTPSGLYRDTSQTAFVSVGPWADAVAFGDGWVAVDWFGTLYLPQEPWIYHAQHGWLHESGVGADALWFWDAQMQAWWWTSRTAYPYVYRASDQTWLWYLEGSTAPRQFFNLRTGAWERVPR